MTNPAAPIPTPPSGGMPKWLIILIVVLLVVILGCCGGITTCFFFARKAVNATPAFIQDQLKKNGTELNLPDATGTTAMPSNFPTDIPVYSGMKTTSSAADLKSAAGQVTFTSTDAFSDIKTFYDKQMTDNGWTATTTTGNGDSSETFYSKENRTTAITISGSSKPTAIVIIYGKK